ncbi:MAG: beta-1,6-N-acetylglucosaminyltransferase [Paracoccaceae bacterium]
MTVGYIMLCHTALDRAAQVARYWASRNFPVVIHVDKRVTDAALERFKLRLAEFDNIAFSPRRPCEWGTWAIVDATIAASKLMLKRFPEVGHVYLSSGSCLPLRPPAELAGFLAAHPQTDFIESVTTADVDWTVGGLHAERFTLRFPFAWKRHRVLFDAYVRLQRLVRFRRHLPEGLVPHLGSQWWCLTRQTLSAILEDPKRRQYDAYFRRVWIPDESYFQSLVRLYSRDIESRSLTLSKFDFQGKPHIFYDDHLQLLRRSDAFVARKIWARADRLYNTFLGPGSENLPRLEPNSGKIDRIFAKAVERRTRGRPGLYMHSRYPNADWENGKTCAPYTVLSGFDHLFQDFPQWLGRVTGVQAHGHLFDPERVRFAGDEAIIQGGISDSAALRDYRPMSFLTNLIWNTRGERQCFMHGPSDRQKINTFLAADHNAQIFIVTGAWALTLFRQNRNFGDIRREAARLQKTEAEFLELLRVSWVKARVRTWTMAEFLDNPMEPLQLVIDEINARQPRRLTEVPKLTDLQGFGQFLQNLKNQGMQPFLVGDFPDDGAGQARGGGSRPYLVR